jgi:hypothetical protein
MRCALALLMVVSAHHGHKPTKHKATVKAAAKHKTATQKRLKRSGTASVHIAAKPEVAVASFHGDGRVRYGRNNMPPGFAWPPTKGMLATEKACEATLTASGITWQPAAAEGKITDPIVVPAMELGGISIVRAFGKGAPTIDCQLARVLTIVGPQLHDLGLREIRVGSVYRNTLVRVHGETKNILSRHALGLAMDIVSFVDANGRVANVELDYLKGDPLLHAIEDTINQSPEFRIVLTPGNDPLSHADHFHIEASVDFTAFR